MALLDVNGVSVRFGGLEALNDVSVKVHAGEVVSLIGPNGAGKTTFFNVVSGLQAPTAGRVYYRDEDVTELPPHRRARLGFGRTFQRVQLFGKLSALDNVLIAAEGVEGRLGVLGSMLRNPGTARTERQLRERARAALELSGAADLAERPAGSLPLGLARRVELARALATLPEIVLLDEPASGLDVAESEGFGDVIRRLPAELGVSVLLVEHDVAMVAKISDEIYVLDFGRLIARGPAAAVLTDPQVIQAYLGREEVA
ncbi:MAG: ABC transporter ATP-binding protein [Actinomycetota bacterium]|jgi:branched-chain amino acid transport system ATP-binding protein